MTPELPLSASGPANRLARYSTDPRWHVPHFEKMLYDNAQLARVYAGAFRLTGDKRLRFLAEDTLTYLLREMHPAAAARLYGMTEEGHWEHGTNAFERRDAQALRAELGMQPDAFAAWEPSVRERLYAARPTWHAPRIESGVTFLCRHGGPVGNYR